MCYCLSAGSLSERLVGRVAEQTSYRWRQEYGGMRTDQARRLKDLEKENARLKNGSRTFPWIKPCFRRSSRQNDEPGQATTSGEPRARSVPPVSERRACRVIGLPRSSQQYQPQVVDREAPLTKQILELATQYGRYGYRRITALLRQAGWRVNHKCVE